MGNMNTICTEAALKKSILENGIQATLMYLGSGNLSEEEKVALSAEYYLVGGYPNLERILSIR